MSVEFRCSGILMPISSLPSPFGIGDLGPGAYAFVDFLARARQRLWQILPLNPTTLINGNSPYSSPSAFACNPLLISPERLILDGYLTDADVADRPDFPAERVDYPEVIRYKESLFERAFRRFASMKKRLAYERFCEEQAHWVDDYAAFTVFKRHFQERVWSQWPVEIRDRQESAVVTLARRCAAEIEREKFLQFLFYRQWAALKKYCRANGVEMFGDIPIYVTYDSADVWTYPGLFKLDEQKNPVCVAGVPPDYFSKTGQRWGNPVYDWEVLQKTGFLWWLERIRHNLELFERVRIDHFRGFVDYWEIPAEEPTAIQGSWKLAPAKEFFAAVRREFPQAPIIAEDLGWLSDLAIKTIKELGFPGMKILMFAFGDDKTDHPFLPQNYTENCVAYTGTHDNNTVQGWFQNEAGPAEKKRLFAVLGKEVAAEQVHREMIRALMESKANAAIFPLQDVLGLGADQRMNVPGIAQGNWAWRYAAASFPDEYADWLAVQARESGRSTQKKRKCAG
ncbi:MAG: 4-alpha-glucanotransferase [Candidatus Omnitrophica bacterium]|nr:4-alpha-glucanotransferase [Candidatus Omnitrophota bacterium]